VADTDSTRFPVTPTPRRVCMADLLLALSNAGVNRFTIEKYGLKGSSDNVTFLRDFTTVNLNLGLKLSPYATSVDDFCVPLVNAVNDRALHGIWSTRRMFGDNVLCHGGPYCGTVEYVGQLQTPVGVVSKIRIYPQ
jgi:hypothetical protein